MFVSWYGKTKDDQERLSGKIPPGDIWPELYGDVIEADCPWKQGQHQYCPKVEKEILPKNVKKSVILPLIPEIFVICNSESSVLELLGIMT